MLEKETKLSAEPYKGVRDFYPEDMFVQNYIFDVWKKTVESYGYEEYAASLIEPTELYKAKSGEEIVNDQTYSFLDRGGRNVTLRPEMTPSIARMVARRKAELAFPLRWYSIPNLFRYEKPQRGRLREHWQLNVDIFGVPGVEAEIEIITIAHAILKSFGAKNEDFEIRINSRKMMNYILTVIFELSLEDAGRVSKLIDKKEKMEEILFEQEAGLLLKEKTEPFLHVLNSKDLNVVISNLKTDDIEESGVNEIKKVMEKLGNQGITNVVFSPILMRGFDYYTGLVFEIFDTDPQNKRSLFGGGRFDDLLSLFGEESVPAFGFGYGDVTMRDFLEIHNLLPSYRSPVDIAIALVGEENQEKAHEFGELLRKQDLKILVDKSIRKIGDKLKTADKKKIPFVIVFGEEEVKTGKYRVKNLSTGEEKMVRAEGIKEVVDKKLIGNF